MRLVLTLALLLLVLWQQPVVKHDKENAQTRAGQTGQKNTPPAGVTPSGAPSQSQSEQQKRDNPSPPDDRVYKVNVISQPRDPVFVVYVVLTLVAVVAGIITAVAVWLQMKANEQTAEAARLNAQAVITAERAWLVGRVEPVSRWLEDSLLPGRLDVVCAIDNLGKTVATVLEKGESYNVQTSIDDLPEIPDYAYTTRWERGVLVAPGTQLRRVLLTIDNTPPDGLQAVITGRKLLFVFGFAHYTDTFGKTHFTRYLMEYEHRTKSFVPRDKVRYNEAT